jgi:3-(3-hydroxy-phenyl)propionate hydroxylase
MPHYESTKYPFVTPPELNGGNPEQYQIAIVGAGPIGLAMSIDLALQGIRSVILDDNNVVSVGSRAICWAKRTLEIFDRLGVCDRMLAKGITWKVGRLFHKDREVYNFDLMPGTDQKMPAFINLQQYYVEEYLVDRVMDFPDLIDLRWLSKVTGHERHGQGVVLHVETPEGGYSLEAEYLLACDGAKSSIRNHMGLAFDGHTFEEHFLIADVEMAQSPFANEDIHERWFWFEPPFHTGQSALLHKQPDNIYRIDLQLDPEADPVEEAKPENVIPRVRHVVGDLPFELDWVSVYSFTCAKMDQFVHGRVIFVGDSAHVVSPFGARGGNGGIQDVDNLGWKLAAVLKGKATRNLLQTYHEERSFAATENILNSSRATNFMTPKSKMETVFRTEVLKLAQDMPFAQKLVNSGRLSVPCSLEGFSLQTPSARQNGIVPGLPCPDAKVVKNGESAWLLNFLGNDFKLLTIGRPLDNICLRGIRTVHVSAEASEPGDLLDIDGIVQTTYGKDMAYLIRPDQHIAACFPVEEAGKLLPALSRASIGKHLEIVQ